MTLISSQLASFWHSQNEHWPFLRAHVEALDQLELSSIPFQNFSIRIQFNPARIISSGAKIDKASLEKRACFLCASNRPVEQEILDILPGYDVLCNPFPIFHAHLTIPSKNHQLQSVQGKIGDMLHLCELLSGYEIFYNGPECGASAPDHFHFQAAPSKVMPLFDDLDHPALTELLYASERLKVCYCPGYLRSTILLEARNPQSIVEAFQLYYNLQAKLQPTHVEPMFNLLARYQSEVYSLVIFPRKAHRPSFYFETGEKQILLSPGAVDMGGLLVISRKEDLSKITSDVVRCMFDEISLNDQTLLYAFRDILLQDKR
ncbi:MAG: DUF4922 domain-containing protein [Bacteroidales bacterium]|nr:DUF4922 domain-containing protein [Bacteroidales bacterium]MDD4820983.1 DUF4922 domain-containing protein [Bacteroidales bacterium]